MQVNKVSFSKIWKIASIEYVKWVCNSRMVLLVIMYIFMRVCVISPLLERSGRLNQPLNLLEPFIAVGNSGFIVLILPIVYLTLMSDYPKTDGNSMMVLVRTGKINWLAGQLIFSFLSILSYLLILFFATVLSVFPYAFLDNGWSLVATDFDYYFLEEAGSTTSMLLPANLYNQMAPYEAAVSTFLFLAMYFFLLVSIMLLFRIYKQKLVGFFISGSLIALGAACCSLKTPLMWVFPMAHSIIWLHFDGRFRRQPVPVFASVLYYAVSCTIIIVLAVRQIKWYSLDNHEEVD